MLSGRVGGRTARAEDAPTAAWMQTGPAARGLAASMFNFRSLGKSTRSVVFCLRAGTAEGKSAFPDAAAAERQKRTQAAREGVCESIRPRAEPHGGKARLERAGPTRWLFETLQSTCFDWSGNRLAMDRKAHERRLIPKGSSQGHRGEDLGEAKRQGRREAHFGLTPGWHPRERAMRTSSRSTRDGRVERR